MQRWTVDASPLGRPSWAAVCTLVALLCILTTALFALTDARASSAVPAAPRVVGAETVVSAESDRNCAPVLVAACACADTDNPFEEGRIPRAEGVTAGQSSDSSDPLIRADIGPGDADATLPERPPRA